MQTKITNLSDLHRESPRVALGLMKLKARQLGVCVVVEAINDGEPRWLVVTPSGATMGTGPSAMSNMDACDLAYDYSKAHLNGAEYFVEMGDVVGAMR